MSLSVTIPEDFDNMRLDQALAGLVPDLSRTRIKALIGTGAVTSNGRPVTVVSARVATGQTFMVEVPEAAPATPQAEAIELDIVYEDDDLIVLNKPAGLVVHPAAGHADGTLVNALLHHCADSLSGIGGVKRPGIVHRLDKDTSGLMLVAKNDHAHAHLSAQLADRSLSRTYTALVWGVPTLLKGTIEAPLGRDPRNRLYMAVRPEGRSARTHYEVIERYGSLACQLRCDLDTGRTHQIRVHCAHMRHPLLGDPLYGLPATGQRGALKRADCHETPLAEAVLALPRQALHATAIRFIHPRRKRALSFTCPLPPDMAAIVDALQKHFYGK